MIPKNSRVGQKARYKPDTHPSKNLHQPASLSKHTVMWRWWRAILKFSLDFHFLSYLSPHARRQNVATLFFFRKLRAIWAYQLFLTLFDVLQVNERIHFPTELFSLVSHRYASTMESQWCSSQLELPQMHLWKWSSRLDFGYGWTCFLVKHQEIWCGYDGECESKNPPNYTGVWDSVCANNMRKPGDWASYRVWMTHSWIILFHGSLHIYLGCLGWVNSCLPA